MILKPCGYPPPSRYWFKRESGLWASREWNEGERKQYAIDVLKQT